MSLVLKQTKVINNITFLFRLSQECKDYNSEAIKRLK